MGRLGSRGIGDSGSRKVLLGFMKKNGEGSRKLGLGGEDMDLGNITEGVRVVWVSVDRCSEGMGAGSTHSEEVESSLE